MSLTKVVKSLPEPLGSTYEIIDVLGVGSYAVVYQVMDRETYQYFALKMIEKEPMRIRNMLPQLKKEVTILEQVAGTPYIAQMLECTETKTHFFLRFDLCKYSLDKLDGPMTEAEALGWLKQACLGLQEIHAMGIIHRDLKPANILVDSRGLVQICDFGFACRESEGLNGMVGSPSYSPPEVRQNGPRHTTKMDIYGLGSCLQHWLLGRIPTGQHDMPKDVSAEMQELLDLLMSPKPQDRPDVDELLDMLKSKGSLLTQWVEGWQIMFSRFAGA